MVADLAGFGSFWALGDCNRPNWARGTISRCRLKLQHQPWALWISGQLSGRSLGGDLALWWLVWSDLAHSGL